MRITHVHVHVKPEHVEDFIEATRRNAEGSVKEPGNIAFDMLQSAENPTWFVLRELFRDAEAVAAHKETEHYQTWRETVADWMAGPRKAVVFNQLFPPVET